MYEKEPKRLTPKNKSPRLGITRRGLGVVVGTTLAAGTTLGVVAAQSNGSGNVAAGQPGCEVPVTGNDIAGLDAKTDNLNAQGAHITGDVRILAGSDHHVRNPQADPQLFLNDGRGLAAGDIAHYDHFDPQVCVKVGGNVVAGNIQLIPASHGDSGLQPMELPAPK